MWRVFPLLALARASCYDYEYYDPDTGSSIPGNACAKQAAGASTTATVGQPAFATQASLATPVTTFPASSFGTAYSGAAVSSISSPVSSSNSLFGSPIVGASTYSAAPISTPTYGAVSAPVYSATTYGAVSATPVYTSAPIAAATTVYSPAVAAVTVRAPVAAVTTVRAPVAAVTTQARTSSASSSSQLSPELQYYKDLGERQAEQHKRNTRVVNRAAKDLSKSSLLNRVIAGPNNAAPFYPAVRLSYQKDVADAYKSEKRIANKNAEDAYSRFQKDPTRLNLLVSKYQDLNADLRDAAYHYNVVNSGTFGQRIASSGLFGSLGGGLFGGLTQIITQRQQSEDLTDIQRQMQRVQRQIQVEVQAAAQQKSATSSVAQGSVQQRMMAMSVYGPAQPQRG